MMFAKSTSTFLIFLTTLFATFSPAFAKVVGITAPPTVSPGQTFPVTVETSSYIQNIYDYYMVFGIAPQTFNDSGLHTLLGLGYDLVANNEYNTAHGSFNVSITIPSDYNITTQGSAVNLRASVFSTVGASQEIWVTYWATNVTVV
ncbi:hypothetical protein DL93DRAFT_2091666 [Clavulina sp. PMI_390]|nr:hypothetical protein DL93DRAFT_2091666 [Clavulina sp. PMI_390]